MLAKGVEKRRQMWYAEWEYSSPTEKEDFNMKSCPTCGTKAEARASFCPCCGTSFVTPSKEQPAPQVAPAPVQKVTKPAAKTPLPFSFEEEKEKKRGNTLPIILISLLSVLAIGLSALWLSGGLEAMLNKDATAKTDGQEHPTVQTRPTIAATYKNGQEITTQQYLAYLYLEFENLYYNQGLYQQELYGIDPWAQTYSYGDEDLLLSDYIIRATQDNIKRQIVLQQMMQENGITWIAEDEAELENSLSKLKQDAYIDLGFNNKTYTDVLKNRNLNERSTFYGLYKTGGARAVSELDLRRYFANNYVSYQMISIPLTDQNGTPLDKNSAAYEKIMAQMSQLLLSCRENGFSVTYVQHTGNAATEARVDADATTMDPALAQAVRTVNVGETTIVEYTIGNTPTIALIERLNTSDVYEENVENIIYQLRYEAFNTEVTEAMEAVDITFDPAVVNKCKPEDFLIIKDNA